MRFCGRPRRFSPRRSSTAAGKARRAAARPQRVDQAVAGALLHREMGDTVHHLVGDDIGRHDRLTSCALAPNAARVWLVVMRLRPGITALASRPRNCAGLAAVAGAPSVHRPSSDDTASFEVDGGSSLGRGGGPRGTVPQRPLGPRHLGPRIPLALTAKAATLPGVRRRPKRFGTAAGWGCHLPLPNPRPVASDALFFIECRRPRTPRPSRFVVCVRVVVLRECLTLLPDRSNPEGRH